MKIFQTMVLSDSDCLKLKVLLTEYQHVSQV